MQVNKSVKVTGRTSPSGKDEFDAIHLKIDNVDELDYILGELDDAYRHLNYVPYLTEMRTKLKRIRGTL